MKGNALLVFIVVVILLLIFLMTTDYGRMFTSINDQLTPINITVPPLR